MKVADLRSLPPKKPLMFPSPAHKKACFVAERVLSVGSYRSEVVVKTAQGREYVLSVSNRSLRPFDHETGQMWYPRAAVESDGLQPVPSTPKEEEESSEMRTVTKEEVEYACAAMHHHTEEQDQRTAHATLDLLEQEVEHLLALDPDGVTEEEAARAALLMKWRSDLTNALQGFGFTKVHNLTPHMLKFERSEAHGADRLLCFPSEGAARVSEQARPAHMVVSLVGDSGCSLPVRRVRYAEIEGLPPTRHGHVYVVSSMVLSALRESGSRRKDVFAPYDFMRNESGHVLYARSLKPL